MSARGPKSWPLVAAVALCLGAWGVACSDRGTVNDSGPLWPDLARDSSAADSTPPDQAVELPPAPDLGPADTLRPDLGPSSWQALQPAPGLNLHGIACLSSGEVLAVGEQGTLLRRDLSAAPAVQFIKQVVGDAATPPTLLTVSFADASYGVTGGVDWRIWESRDLGQSWATAPQCSAYTFYSFNALHLSAANAGFAAGAASSGAGGGYKYFSGYSWVCGGTPYAGQEFFDIWRAGKLGWMVGQTGGQIYRTEDEGMSWTPLPAGTLATLRAVAMRPSGQGLAVGRGGTIVRSSDGAGKVWSPVASGTAADLYDVAWADDQRAVAVGAGGVLLRTTDGGQSWSLLASPTTARLEAVCFTTPQQGWAVGQAGTLIHTSGGS